MAEKRTRKYPLWRRLIRWVVYGIFSFIAFIILALYIVLLIPALNRPILKTALPKVGSILEAKIEVGSFSYNLFTGNLLIKDALFTKPDPNEKKPFAKADEIRVRLNVLELIGGLIHINSVQISGASNYLRITEKGLENLPVPPSKEEPLPKEEESKTESLKPIKFPLIVDSVTVKDAQFTLELEKPYLTVVVGKIEGKLSCDMYDKQLATADIKISNAQVQYEKLKENIESLEVESEFSFADFSVKAEKIFLKSERLETSANFSLTGLKWRKISMQFLAPYLSADASVAKDMFEQDVSGKILIEDILFKAQFPDYSIFAKMRSDSLRYRKLEIGELEGNVSVAPCKIDVYPIRLETDAGTITARTNFNYCENSVGNVKLKSINVPKLLRSLDIETPVELKAVVSGDIDFELWLKPELAVNFNARLNSDELKATSALSVKRANIKTSGEFKKSALKSVRLSFGGEGLNLNASGDVNFSPLSLWLNYDLSTNPSLITPYKIAGDIKIEGKMSGAITSAKHEANIKSERVDAYGFTLDFLNARIDGNGLSFNVTDFSAKAMGADLAISGGVDLTKQKLEADVNLDNINLSELKNLLKAELAGRGSIKAKASGKLSSPTAVLKGEFFDISAFGEEVDSAILMAGFENMKLEIQRAEIKKGAGFISAVGSFDLNNKELSVTGNIDSLDLEKLAFAQKFQVKGVSNGTFELGGKITDLLGKAEFNVSSLEIMAQSLGELMIKAEPIELPKRVGLNASLPDAGLTASSDVNLETKTIGFFVELKDHPLAAWLGMAGLKDAQGVASLNGTGYIPLNNPLELDAKLTFTKLEINWQEKALMLKKEGYLAISKGRFSDANLQLTGDLVNLDITGAEGAWFVSAKLDLENVSEILKLAGELRGNVEVDAQISGKATEPNLEGTASLGRGFVDMPHLPQPIDSLSADLWFDSSKIRILSFTARTGGGEARIEGEVSYRPQIRVLLSATARSIRTGYEPTLTLMINSANLLATGTLDNLSLAGDVLLNEAVVTQNIDLQTLLLSLRKKAVGVKTFKPQAEWINFNITVSAERGLFFKSNVAEIEAASDLMITGTNQKLGILGTVNLIEGWADVLKNRFTLTSAVVQFYDPNRIFPMFDINAETLVQGITIRVNISGTPDGWRITFSSEPPRSEQDIVALLSLGVDYETFKQTGMAQTASEEVAYRAAAQLLGSSVNRFFGKYANMSIDIDTSQTPARLKLSADLSEDLAFSFYREISSSGVEAQLEYSFFPFVSLLGNWRVEPGITQELGAIGGGLKFKLEFQ